MFLKLFRTSKVFFSVTFFLNWTIFCLFLLSFSQEFFNMKHTPSISITQALSLSLFLSHTHTLSLFLLCVSKIEAFIVKNIDTIIFWHVLLVGLIFYMQKIRKKIYAQTLKFGLTRVQNDMPVCVPIPGVHKRAPVFACVVIKGRNPLHTVYPT